MAVNRDNQPPLNARQMVILQTMAEAVCHTTAVIKANARRKSSLNKTAIHMCGLLSW